MIKLKNLLLITGIPGVGKSYLADVIEKSDIGYSHVSLDRYIQATPTGQNFFTWVRTPECIDWELIQEHFDTLAQGGTIQVPRGFRPNGDPKVTDGPTISSQNPGFTLPGSHAFACPDVNFRKIKIYVKTPEHILAARYTGEEVDPKDAREVISKALGGNDEPLRRLEQEADFLIDGSAEHATQIAELKKILQRSA